MRINQLFESVTVTVNRELNPQLWRSGQLDPEVKQHLLKIAEHFEEFVGIDLEIRDITITGSNANYTWTQHSDMDLHLVVAGTPTDQERELYSAKKSLWSEQHDIRIRGHEVECYVQGEDEPHHSTGVYSLANDSWVIKPQKTRPTFDDNAVDAKYQDLSRIVTRAITQGQLPDLERVKDKITKMRKAGLERAGEWSTENLVFKELRREGMIDQLTDRIRELEDQALSLENRQ